MTQTTHVPGSRHTVVGVLLVLVSATSFGAMAIFARIAYRGGADPHGVLLVRFGVAAVILTAIMFATSAPWPRGRDLRLLILMGSVGYFAQSLTYFSAVTRIPAGLVAVIFYTYPVLVAVCSAVLTRRRPSTATFVAAVLATVGVALVAGPSRGGDLVGIGLAMAAAVVYTGYILAGGSLSTEVRPLASTTTVCLAAAGMYAGGCLAHTPHLPGDAAGWTSALATAVISTVVAVTAFLAGIQRLGGAPSAAISCVEPVITALLAYLVFAEHLTWLQITGAGLVCVSVTGVALSAVRRPAPSVELREDRARSRLG